MSRLAVLLAVIFSAPAFVAAADKPVPKPAVPPNVVVLLADDTGYGDLGCTGHPYAKTPAIDQMAKDGALFKRFYVGGATCCPSRTALMTGRFPATFQKYPAGGGFADAVTVSELLHKGGYATGHVGKWHIGPDEKAGTYGLDVVRVSGGNRRDPRGRDGDIADAAVDFIRANKGKPFYLNVWFHTAHNPVDPPQAFVDRYKDLSVNPADFKSKWMADKLDGFKKDGRDVTAEMRKYAGDVSQLDGQVARVLKALDDAGVRENTLVVFFGDNGPHDVGSAGPFRGGKHELYEGGIRQPLIVRWPAGVKAGRADDRCVLAAVDWLPTVCKLCGVKADADKLKLVGEDVSDILTGAERDRKGDLFWKASSPRSTPVIRRGDWKLFLPYGKRGEPELFDLKADPGETKDVAAAHPQVVKELSAALKKWNDTLPASYEKTGGDD